MILHQISNSRGNYNYNAFLYTDKQWDAHFHRNYELVYVFGGTVVLVANGAEEVLEAGEMILIPPQTVHSLRIRGGKTWIGVFSEDFVVSFAKKYSEVRFSKFRCEEELDTLLRKHLFYEGQPDHFRLIALLYAVCDACVKYAVPCDTEQNNRFIFEVISYISENIGRELSLKDVAEEMNYEYHYFSALFHRYFGMNFKNFINLFRFEQACEQLTREGSSITAVAESCGFGSIRNFNRVFKKLSGCTPKEFKGKERLNRPQS